MIRIALNKNDKIILSVVLFFGILLGIFMLNMEPKIEPILKNKVYADENVKINTTGSGSMYPGIMPDEELSIKYINDSETLYCGHSYIFNNSYNQSIVHRFVYQSKNGSIYFKGDNNLYMDEPVLRNNIYAEVIGVIYE